MSPILLLTVGYLLVLGAIVLVCFLGDPRSQSPLGQATYFFTVYLPVTAEHVLKKVPGGGALVGCVSKSYDYACNKPNPLLQIVYLLLVLGGFLAFQIEAMPFIPNKYLGEIHLYTSHIAVLTTLATFLLASNSNPGVVTSQSLRMHDSFPYDGFLYVKRDCSTCKIRKVARSKHCSICNVCVSKFDHHCPWINTCVGEANYRVFLTFLLCTASLLFYAMYGLSLILIDYVEEKKLFSRQFKHMETGQIVPASYSIVFTYLFLQKATLIMLLVLCTVMGVVVFLFFLYHLYLISQNTTTNESSKWGSVKGFYKNIAKRGAVPDRSPEEEKELVNPDTAPSLEGRAEDQFPAVKPANIYNKGIFANFAEVFFPPCFTSAVAPPSTTSSSALKSSNASKKKKSKRN